MKLKTHDLFHPGRTFIARRVLDGLASLHPISCSAKEVENPLEPSNLDAKRRIRKGAELIRLHRRLAATMIERPELGVC